MSRLIFRTNKDAYKALALVLGFPAAGVLVIGYPYSSMTKIEELHLLQLFFYSMLILTPDQIVHSYTKRAHSKLQKLRQYTLALTGTAGLFALLSFPDQGVTVTQFIWEDTPLVLLLIVVLPILIFRLNPFISKKSVILKMAKICAMNVVFTGIIVAMARHAHTMTSSQILAMFLVSLGIVTHQIWPGNAKVNAIIKQSTGLEKQVIDLLKRLSFSAGITVLITFAQPRENVSVSNLIAVFLIVFILHWIITLIQNSRVFSNS